VLGIAYPVYRVSFTMASSMSFQHMPIEVTAHILRYVGTAGDLLNCEKTCKKLRWILRDDAAWSSSPGASRDSACQFQGYQKVRKYQKGCESILLEVLGVARWKMLVRQALGYLVLDDGLSSTNDHLSLRGDTSAVLMELVENFAIVQLKRAGVVMNATTPVESQQTYPTVTVRHWEAQNELHSAFAPSPNSTCTPLFAGVLLQPTPRDAVLFHANALLLETNKITTIIRRLAYRAGIIKMEDGVFDLAWGSLVCSIAALLRPACIQLEYACGDYYDSISQKGICVEMGETMYTVPPYTKFVFCEDCRKAHIALHTPVPGQIEDAARSLSIPFKVYGDVWHCMPDSTEEDERDEAESDYFFLDEDEYEGYHYLLDDSDSDSDDDAIMKNTTTSWTTPDRTPTTTR
jgi:hypothetical protein